MDKINAMMKHLLLISLICVLVGGGVAIAGIALGGTLGDASISVGNWKLLSPWPFRGSGSYQVDDADTADAWTESADGACSVPAENITDLDIVLHNCQLVIGTSEDASIYVSPDPADQEYWKIEQNDGALEIIDTRDSKQAAKLKSIKLRIEIPENKQFEDISLDLGAGEIQVKDLRCMQMEINGGAGIFQAQSLRVSDLFDAKLGVGDFCVEKAVLGDTQIKCGIGSMQIKNCKLNGDATVKGGVGDAMIGLDAQETDYNYDLKCGVGELSVFGTSYHSLGKNKQIDNDADDTITLKCGVGSMCVKQAKTTL